MLASTSHAMEELPALGAGDLDPAAILFGAVAANDVDTVKRFLSESETARMEVENREGFTALHLAALHSRVPIAEVLVAHTFDVRREAADGRTPLILAAQNGDLQMATLLLDHGAEPDFRSAKFPFTALWEACTHGHLELARFLVDQGADVDLRNDDGTTPLLHAVRNGRPEIVEMLLQKGASKRIRLKDDTTILDAVGGNDAIRHLLETDILLQGPKIRAKKKPEPQSTLRPLPPPPPRDDEDKQMACRGFEATMVEFFLGDREERIGISAPIYEVLYGKGPKAMLIPAREQMGDVKPNFTWYHVPCNNVGILSVNTENYHTEPICTDYMD